MTGASRSILSERDRARRTSSRFVPRGCSRRADIVFHDALVQPAMLALARERAKVEVGKRSGRHLDRPGLSTAPGRRGAQLPGGCAAEGRRPAAVRPRAGRMAALERRASRYELVPGVTAALAAAAAPSRPSPPRHRPHRRLPHPAGGQGRRRRPSGCPSALARSDSVVLYMAAGPRLAIDRAGAHRRGQAGPPTPVALVESATLPGEAQTSSPIWGPPCGGVDAARPRDRSLMCVGEVFRDPVPRSRKSRSDVGPLN